MSKSCLKERNKAIRKAWEREQELVSEGKGTRDWSQDQQKDILDPGKGKAYDENGRAFEGQHMKSAAEYPEYQGDPDNIQFLTRDEHLEAHKGSWQNPTNWYYNPEPKEFVDFGESKPIPCEVISLSEPVRSPAEVLREDISSEKSTSDEQVKSSDADAETKTKTEHTEAASTREAARPSAEIHKSSTQTPPPSKAPAKGGRGILAAIKGFAARHPVLTGLGISAAATAGKIAVDAISDALTGNSGGGTSGGGGLGYSSSSDSSDDYSGYSDDDDYGDSSSSRDYPDERSSPREHDVSGYDRQQNKKTVHVKPYKRGGKHDDD